MTEDDVDLPDTVGLETLPDAGEVVLESGTHVGRYVVLSRIGGGAGGAVYAAYDPELDRKMAIKLLFAGTSGSTIPREEARARLLREAQAMAKLAHPNVVSVHDVGTHDDRVFIAMELVPGGSMRAWLRAPHGRRETMEVVLAAGRGLFAAHKAGFVHRDFKPENVLVGTDGRVRVTDFGLVRTEGRPSTEVGLAVPAASPSTANLTRVDAIMGTPGYMAPEQYLALPTDARADQFAFCVTAWEALTGQRPFGGATYEERSAAALSGRIEEPPRRKRLPSWLRNVFARGLATAPDGRWPDMGALLDAMERDPWTRARRFAVPVAALGAAAAAAAAMTATRPSATPPRADPCGGGPARVASVWNDAVSTRLDARFRHVGGAGAESRIARTRAAVVAYGDGWASAHREACEASRVRAEQPESVLALRMTCLEGRLKELGHLMALFTEADGVLVERAPEAVARLSPLRMCSDVAALQAPVPPPSDSATRAAVDGLRERFAEGRALGLAGRYKEGLVLATTTEQTARDLRWPPALAEALVLRAGFLEEAGDAKAAESEFQEAVHQAFEGRDDGTFARAAVRLESIASYWFGRHAEAESWGRFAAAAIARIGGNDELEVLHLREKTLVLIAEGKSQDAIATAERALRTVRAASGTASADGAYREALILGTLGSALHAAGQDERALEKHKEALAQMERVVGADHPRVAAILNNMGNAAQGARRYDESIGYFARALALDEQSGGADHPNVAIDLGNMGNALRYAGRCREALAIYGRALAIYEKAFGPKHPDSVLPLVGLGECRRQLGDAKGAIPLLERAEALVAGDKELDPRVLAVVRFHLGAALWDGGRERAHARRLVADAARAYGPAEDVDYEHMQEWLIHHGAP